MTEPNSDSESQGADQDDLLDGALYVTQQAALAASVYFGRRNENAANVAAADGMRRALASLAISGRVVMGEGMRGVAPILYNGEKIGTGGPEVELALDAIEGATSTARGGNNAITVLVMIRNGKIFSVPDVYMEKIAVGPNLPRGVVSLDSSPAENVRNLAEAKGVDPSDIVVCMLDRPRHDPLFAKVIASGGRTMAIPDGDISGIMAVARPDTGVDMYMGSGGAPEGILAAAALRCLGGQMDARLVFRNEDERQIAAAWGIHDIRRIYAIDELISGDIYFAATGVTNGILTHGVRRGQGTAITHSLIAAMPSGRVDLVEAEHATNL